MPIVQRRPVNGSSYRAGAATLAFALVAAGCAGSGDDGRGGPDGSGEVVAQFASYDRAAQHDQRVIVGLLAEQEGQLAYGTVEFRFAYLGTSESPEPSRRVGAPVTATYRALPGTSSRRGEEGPTVVSAAESRGVYAADDVRFDKAGLWSVIVTGKVDGDPFEATAAFEVNPEPYVVAEGEPAPRTANPLPGAPGVKPQAIDSRAADDGIVPDPELHTTTVADALTAGQPVIVVVATPVYCVSRFCGPITDAVQQLATEYGDRIAFVHLEVWNDFENQVVNDGAAEWITPRGGRDRDLREPWVFVVGADGTIAERFDNVASEDELRAAAQRLAGQ
ncbi:MAG: hypothetical protein ACRDZ1_03675 [Acidimicrobiia bacterium]